MPEERFIIVRHEFLCGVCAMEFKERELRTPALSDWLARLAESGEAIMRTRVVHIRDVTDAMVGCGPCWGHAMNVPASFALELTIDGDA